MKNIRIIIVVMHTLMFFSLTPLAGWAQTQPNSLDNFLDEDDFDGPPPGAAPPAKPNDFNRKGFGGDVNTPPPPSDLGTSAGSGKKGGPAAKPEPRRKRKEPPNLLAKRPPNMAEATDRDITDTNFPDLIDSFDYPNAEITDIVKAISELTGKNFIVDPQVHGKITIIAPTRITVAEAYKAFLSALSINSLTVVPSGKFLKIKMAQNALRDNIDTYAGSYAPNTDVMITRIVHLRYISAKEFYNALGSMFQGGRGEIKTYEPTNTLIISDYGSNIERIMKILGQLDVPGFEEQIEVIRVRFARAGELAKLVDQIVNKGKSSQQGGGFTAGIPRFTPLGGNPSGGNEAYSLVIPDDRTNSLIVVGNTEGIAKIKKLVGKLDFKMRPEDSGGVYVYYVRFGDAEKIATTLSGLAQAATQANTNPQPTFGMPAAAPIQKTAIFGGDVKIVADKLTNSLVVTASKVDYEVVLSILHKLDRARDQVYVEAIIMEIQINNKKSWGLSFYNLAGDTFAGRVGFAGDVKTSQFIDPSSDTGAILGFGGGGTVHVTPPGAPAGTAPIAIPSLVGFINFLAQNNVINILSTPQIMALDNEEATLEVGEKIPVTSTISNPTNAPQTITPTREDVTIKLVIKPHISPASNNMRLEIDQKVQDLGGGSNVPPNLSANAVSTTQRNAKTNVMIRDGDTMVLGGLMKDKEEVKITKVPLLGDIPILGWLFKNKSVQVTKQNLLMFLTPRIIRSKAASNELLTDKLKERLHFIEKETGGKDLQGEYLDNLRLEKNGKVQPLK